MELKELPKVIQKSNYKEKQKRTFDFFPTQIKPEEKPEEKPAQEIVHEEEEGDLSYNGEDIENLSNDLRPTKTKKEVTLINIQNIENTPNQTNKSLINIQTNRESDQYLSKKLKLDSQTKQQIIFKQSAWFKNQNKQYEELQDQINEIYSKSPINMHDIILAKSSSNSHALPRIKAECRSKSTTNLDLLLNKSRENFYRYF